LEVIATHQNSNEQVTVIDGLTLSGPHNGADAHTPSTMSLPQSGMWKLGAFVDGNLHGSVFVKVYE
ncbi:hypothetical protein, partial [Pseudomonas sp. 2822-17]|uniref:hypothetical protein n=1 Tax=Pseudomonas sp. 2822-17 TaxID=1712678 RepID=UPI001C48576D